MVLWHTDASPLIVTNAELEPGTQKFLKEKKTMENGGVVNREVETVSTITIKGILSLMMQNIDKENGKRVISLGMGDPTAYSCFHTTPVAGEAVVDALQSEKFNGYAPTVGLLQTRR